MSRDCAVGLLLTEQEDKRFSDLFSFTLPDADTTGRVAAGVKVGELFQASQLPPDTLHQIMNLCGATQLGYFGRGQFYIALKLIAAAQSNLPVQLESINCELPLPQFPALRSDNDMQKGSLSQNAEIHGQVGRTISLVSSSKGVENVQGKVQEPVSAVTLPIDSPPSSPRYQKSQAVSGDGRPRFGFDQNQTVTHEGSPTAGSVVHPTGQTHGSYMSKPSLPHSLYNRKQPTVQPADPETQENPSDDTDDPWRITEEQREYYYNQFKTLQPDMKSLISGAVAKELFTKSKLPIRELSHIWELSDVDCDGALTLFEFCAAFHLVVARKNGYSLPATLPETLMPEYLQRSEVFLQMMHEDILLCSHGNSTIDSRARQQQWTSWDHSEENIVAESVPTKLSASTFQQPELHFQNEKSDLNWSTNARFKQMSGEYQRSEDAFSLFKAGCKELDCSQKTKTRPRSYSSTSAEDAIKKGEVPPTPPPRLPKTHSRASSLDLNKLFQQGNQVVKSSLSQPPPAVPPRPPTAKITPFPNKAETSNVSAEQLEKVQQPNFADFSKFSEQENIVEKTTELRATRIEEIKANKGSLTDLSSQMKRPSNLGEENSSPIKDVKSRQPPLKPLRRKHRPESQGESQEPLPRLNSTSAPDAKLHQQLQKMPSKHKKAIQTAVRKNKEANMILVRLNGELQQQFKEVRKERIALESQLEQLRPVSHT
ncbi:ralBP1-associated Eps domain-containing protein 2 isoform X1 [Stegostoma tigrinum]|uniref:ralBP1-associated Eps domain-containing protein 2 isoform X1 n=1 Tax=Stegostoma tigrinum TaxID=3053191 RepID=UPI0028709DA4|nr:ralBP1-associated Eps domain-containing protein 2 isoform X1 [Stegostoma tigrinum]